MARDLAKLSYFISLSKAILLASLRLVSISSISTSLFMVLDSQCLQDLTIFRILGHESELHAGVGKLGHRATGLFLKQQHTARLGIHILIFVLEIFFSLVHLGCGCLKLLEDFFHRSLKFLDFLAHVTD